MTDEQVIKALELCYTNDICDSNCEKCPLETYDSFCMCVLFERVLDLIIRQQAEIEELTERLQEYKSFPCFTNDTQVVTVSKKADGQYCADRVATIQIDKIRAEAIEEVLLTLEAEAESSDKFIREYDDSKEQKAYNQALWKAYNLVKELTEESNGE